MRSILAISLVALVSLEAAAADQSCPATPQAWQTYRDQAAATLSQSGGVDQNGAVYKFVSGCLGQLSDGSPAKTQATTCLKPILDLLATEGIPHDTLGFSVPDAEYYARTSSITVLPDELASPAFVALISTWDKTDGLAQYFQTLNTQRATAHQDPIQWLVYQTPLTTPDDAHTPGRLLVVAPDPTRHRTVFAQFGLTPPGSTAFSSHIFTITVLDTDGGKHEGYFHRYEKVKLANGTIAIGEATDATPLDACADCHKSGGPLVIERQQIEQRFQDTAAAIEHLELGYGAISSPYDLNPKRGPGLGTPTLRTPEFIAACAADALNITAADKKADVAQMVLQGMNCAECHDGAYRGRLNMPLNPVIMGKYFWSGMMPPEEGATLTTMQRSAIMTCLQVEYFGPPPAYQGTLYKFLTAPGCQ